MTLPTPTPDEMAKIEQAKARHAELKAKGEYEATVSYKPARAGINAFNKKLTTVTNYRISEFYKASKVRQALASVKLEMHYYKHPAEVTQLDTSTATVNQADGELIDNEAIKSQLLKHLPAVKHHLESLASDYLAVTEWHKIPADNDRAIKPLKAYFEALPSGGFKLKSGKQKELLDALAKLPKHTSTSLMLTEQADAELLLPSGIVAVQKLTEQIGIEPVGEVMAYLNSNPATGRHNTVIGGDGTQYKDTADVITTAIHTSHKIALEYLVATLARMREQADSTAKRSRARSNIRDGHDALPRPATTTLGELFESSRFDTERLIRIYDDDIRTPEKLHEVGGYKLHATQQLLPLFKASNDYKTLEDLLRANIPQLEKVLITVLREAEKTGGLKDGDRWTKIATLAEPMYKEQIAKRGKLDKVYREAYTNNLRMLDALQFYRYEKPSKSGGGIYSKFKFIELKKIETNKAGNVMAVKWALHPEFIKIAHTLIYVNADKFLEIKSPNAQMLATYINDTFVMSDAQANRTIKGEPISRQARLLADKAGLSKSNVTERYRYLTDNLNELEELGIIKWQASNGGKQVKATDKSSQKVIIWPSKNTSGSHITRALNASNKQAEQAELTARQAELKKLVNIYRNDLKAAKDSTEYKKYLASDLGVKEQEIDLMLFKGTKTSKPQPITDGLLQRIRGLASD